LLVDCISAVGSKSTAFGALVSIVGFNATNDKLILDTDITLRGDITATNKVIGTVAGLEYTYTGKQCFAGGLYICCWI
jgi:hypothetical protein